MLGTEQEPALVDTVVMAIMGYFQLKARPGAFALQLAQGRSQMLYAVDNSTAGVAAQVCPITDPCFRPPLQHCCESFSQQVSGCMGEWVGHMSCTGLPVKSVTGGKASHSNLAFLDTGLCLAVH